MATVNDPTANMNDSSFNELKDKASNRFEEAKDKASNRFEEVKDKAANRLEEAKDNMAGLANKAGRRVRTFFDSTTDEVCHATESVTRQIRTNPVQSSMIALGVGFVIGAFMRR